MEEETDDENFKHFKVSIAEKEEKTNYRTECDNCQEKKLRNGGKINRATCSLMSCVRDMFLGNTKHLIGLPSMKKHVRPPLSQETSSGNSQESESFGTEFSASSDGDVETEKCFKTYGRRYYIWSLFCMIMVVNTFMWNSLGPITPTIKYIFDWQDFHIGILSAIDSLVFLVSSVLISNLIDRKGVRSAVLLCCFSLLATSASRSVIFESKNINFIMFLLSQIFNGIASSFTQISITVISSLWFPTHQRATATATVCIFESIGVSTSYILGPVVVGDPPTNSSSLNKDMRYKMTATFLHYMRSLIGFAAAVTVLSLCYFPNGPAKPPTFSASLKKQRLVHFDFKNLLRKKNYLLVMFSVSIYTGVANSWINILSLNLLEWRNMSTIKVGYICFASTFIGCWASIIVSRLSDRYQTKKKAMSMICYILAILGSCSLCTLTFLDNYKHIDFCIYLAVGLIIVSLQANLPLFFELIVEDAFPSDEGTATLVVIWCQNLVMVLFFTIFCVPNIKSGWMNWLMMGTTIICAFLMACHTAKYRRTYVDTMESTRNTI